MMNKHAYLIIAHNEFDILCTLIELLDDYRNDIYVHIDKKAKDIPELKAKKSPLYILDKRIDVRWGNYSQITCEYLLWETAFVNGPYDFYHLISGTHLPLKTQDEIHSYFDGFHGKSVLCKLEKRESDYQEILKVHRYNILTSTYASSNSLIATISQFLWKAFIAMQRWTHITINDGTQFYWSNNWCSLSHEAVKYLVEQKNRIIKEYRWSFCGDEWFVPTELMNSKLKDSIAVIPYLYNNIGRNNASELGDADIPALKSGVFYFARKFSSRHTDILNEVICGIKSSSR